MRWFLVIIVAVLALSQARASPATALASAAKNVKKQANPTDIRYLDLSSIPEDYRKEVLQVLTFQLNSLSTEPDFAVPKVITAELLAINLLDYDSEDRIWRKTFEKLAEIDPYFHTKIVEDWPGGLDKKYNKIYPAGKYTTYRAIPPYKGSQQDLDDLIHYTHSQVPIIRADFLFVQMARQLSLNNKQTGVGYYDFLGLKNKADFDKLVVFKEADSIKLKKEIRAAIKDSGVASQNRAVVRFQALTGGYWITLDTNNSVGKSNVIENPGRGELEFLANEIYGVLPNGLFVYFLSDQNGNRQDTAPDFIGPDDSPLRSGHDARIHVGLSCIRCHDDGLRSVSDWFRKNARTPLSVQTVDYKKAQDLRRQYFSNLDNALRLDRSIFADSVKQCNGLSVADNAKAFNKFWEFGTSQVGRKEAALSYGITEDELVKYFKDYATRTGGINLTLSGLIQEPEDKIIRTQWEELQPILREFLR